MSNITFSAQYTALINDAVKHLPVPAAVHDFLLNVWVEVLVVSAMRYGPDHFNTLSLKKTVMDLVWASEAKRTRRSRARTIKETPLLMDRIRDGMNLIGLPVDQQAAHIERISAPLLDAFLAIEARLSPVRPSAASQVPLKAAPAPATQVKKEIQQIRVPDLDVTEKQTDSAWSYFEEKPKGPQRG